MRGRARGVPNRLFLPPPAPRCRTYGRYYTTLHCSSLARLAPRARHAASGHRGLEQCVHTVHRCKACGGSKAKQSKAKGINRRSERALGCRASSSQKICKRVLRCHAGAFAVHPVEGWAHWGWGTALVNEVAEARAFLHRFSVQPASWQGCACAPSICGGGMWKYASSQPTRGAVAAS